MAIGTFESEAFSFAERTEVLSALSLLKNIYYPNYGRKKGLLAEMNALIKTREGGMRWEHCLDSR
jgi:hypothetical protein